MKSHCLLENLTSWWMIFNSSSTWGKITHRQGVFSNLTAGQSHDVWRVKSFIHGGALTGVNDEEQLVVPGDKHTHAHTRTNRGSYTFSNKTDGRMHSWHNTHPFVPINRYYTNLLTIFHIAVTMVTKKNQQLHSVLLTLPCTQLNHHPLPFPSLHPPFLQNTTFHYNFFPLFRQTCRDCHIQ